MRRADFDPDWLLWRFERPVANALEIAEETGYAAVTVRTHARQPSVNSIRKALDRFGLVGQGRGRGRPPAAG